MRYPGIFTDRATPPADSNRKSSAMYHGECVEIRMIVPKIDRHSMTCPRSPKQHRHRCAFVPCAGGSGFQHAISPQKTDGSLRDPWSKQTPRAPPQLRTLFRLHQPIMQRDGHALVLDKGALDSLRRDSHRLTHRRTNVLFGGMVNHVMSPPARGRIIHDVPRNTLSATRPSVEDLSELVH